MRLKDLRVYRWSVADPLRGEITFATEDGDEEIKMKLDEQLSVHLVSLCADAIARGGEQAAVAIRADALAATAIEHKPGDDE